MENHNKSFLVAIALPLVSAMLFVPVRASADESPWSFTVGVGAVTSDLQAGAINDELAALGHQVSVYDIDDDRTGFSAWVGYQWRKNLRFEVGYLDYGDITLSASGQAADPEVFKRDLADTLPLSGHGVAVTVRPGYDLTERLAVYGRVGPFFWKGNRDVEGLPSIDDSDDGVDWLIGAGVEWRFAPSWAIGLGWDRGHFDSDESDMFSLSVTYRQRD
ncbi:Opacity protein [Ferrimonas sediminum]|uniref:Opacity protein n=1 Tax=Ferrimonas sediminum TaxID=718193 RepID=A0A1G8Y9A2_9GAMM|nr:outer membrane beta-barrel protein [Ferrimonas sediminum]SDJ99432.1 Opacity protein [Ferrimonas sediminum]